MARSCVCSGVFFMMTIGYRYPELSPWIEDIMSKATDKFKNDPYVKDFYQKALENQAIMNGMKDMNVAPAGAAPAQPMPGWLYLLKNLNSSSLSGVPLVEVLHVRVVLAAAAE